MKKLLSTSVRKACFRLCGMSSWATPSPAVSSVSLWSTNTFTALCISIKTRPQAPQYLPWRRIASFWKKPDAILNISGMATPSRNSQSCRTFGGRLPTV
ncbi:hypothetical protein I352_05905 [Cryptococcus deuterogattii MMRL2647]|nr:hypothetical protein I352_05905 [Cryptococcus deuterogattii MMRL2647]